MTDEHDSGTADSPPDAGSDEASTATETDDEDAARTVYAFVLEYLPHGRADDDRPQHRRPAVAYALGERDFRLFEFELTDDAEFGIDDRVQIEPETAEGIKRAHRVDYEDLNRGARQELEYVVEDIVEENEERFVDFYNDAEPITLRLHQLNLLPGIGKKLRNNVLEERKRGPFESFDELSERVSGLHDPKGTLVDRVMEELRDDDLKYRIFVGVDAPTADKT